MVLDIKLRRPAAIRAEDLYFRPGEKSKSKLILETSLTAWDVLLAFLKPRLLEHWNKLTLRRTL